MKKKSKKAKVKPAKKTAKSKSKTKAKKKSRKVTIHPSSTVTAQVTPEEARRYRIAKRTV